MGIYSEGLSIQALSSGIFKLVEIPSFRQCMRGNIFAGRHVGSQLPSAVKIPVEIPSRSAITAHPYLNDLFLSASGGLYVISPGQHHSNQCVPDTSLQDLEDSRPIDS